MSAPPSGPWDPLARHLALLGSPTRLELLHRLRAPQAVSEIRVRPSVHRAGERPARPMSRQGMMRHLGQLLDAGLVRRVRSDTARGDEYVVNHERLFAVVSELRDVARLKPALTEVPLVGATVVRDAGEPLPLPPPPRLVVAFGRDDGLAFGLEGREGAGWTIGRGPACDVRLDYDPYCSAVNSRVRRARGGYVVEDVAGSRNGTCVNWRRLPAGGAAQLRPGDVVTVGRSVLVFQA